MTEQAPEIELTPLEYAVYGALCAAKRETGPGGARRAYRIMERIDVWNQPMVEQALTNLMGRGWVRQLDPVMGFVHFEAVTQTEAAG